MNKSHKPLTLIILDGWGYTEHHEYNAIFEAHTPTWDRLWQNAPRTFLRASGAEVGLPANQMGNSEVGHLNLGTGRVVYQEFTRISRSIRTGSFFTNHTLTDAVDLAKEKGSAVHIMGLLSLGGVHSHEDHIIAMAELAAQRGIDKIYLHAYTDGRDTPPKSASSSIQRMNQVFKRIGKGRFASLIGRYYAMDRDNRWERLQKAYDLIVNGQAEFEANDAIKALEMAYERGETDEFVQATAIVSKSKKRVRIKDDDVVVFMNFRSDRARQITRAFIEPKFNEFKRSYVPKISRLVCLTEYKKEFDAPVAFPSERLENGLGEYIADKGLRQLRIAETEKYAHVTFFFNGGSEKIYEGEDRILIDSPKVKTYDLKPEMSAKKVTDKLIKAMKRTSNDKPFYDVIICNYANSDMVGHTGNMEAAIKAVEYIDSCLQQLINTANEIGAELLITADHGNIEKMRDLETEQPHTAHTTNLVPFIYVGNRAVVMNDKGVLSDVAPTMLSLMGLESPRQMTGRSLIGLPKGDVLENQGIVYGITGIHLGTACAGIKQTEHDDLTLIKINSEAQVAAVFTRNDFCAAPVQIARQHLQEATPRFLLINSGNANAGTGQQGMDDALACCQAVADQNHCKINQVLPFSTGVIGQYLPVDKINPAIPKALRNGDWQQAAKAIMTTDTVEKIVSSQIMIQGKTVNITGIAKGSGMICPDMATLLAFIATDAKVSKKLLQTCLQQAVNKSFNRITVDGDTSTNDACVLIATGKAGHTLLADEKNPDYQQLQQAISHNFQQLAKMIIRDGEGATKFITVQVAQGRDERECLKVAYTIAHSPLVKTAFFASDANWGRILAAVGRSGLTSFDLQKVKIYLNHVCIVENAGRAAHYTEEQGKAVMQETDITIKVLLGRGEANTEIWTTDLSYDYVKINAEYRT